MDQRIIRKMPTTKKISAKPKSHAIIIMIITTITIKVHPFAVALSSVLLILLIA